MEGISFRQVSKAFGDRPKNIFENLSFRFEEGKFYALFGPSGIGKTTLVNMMSGLIVPDRGSISPGSNKQYRLSYVFQNDRLLPWLNVYENIELVLEPIMSDKKKIRSRIGHYLKLFEMSKFKDSYPKTLSFGEKQRINLIRGLVVEADVVLMDEPFSHLDEITASKIRTDLMRIWEKHRGLVVFITHNVLEAVYFSDEILVLNDRPVKELKVVKNTLARPRSNKFYSKFLFEKETSKLVNKVLRLIG